MMVKNNSLTLNENTDADMKARVPAFITFEQLLARFPVVAKRRWTEKDFAVWIEQDIISGRGTSKGETLEIDATSFEDFLEYHNNFLRKRSEAALEGIEEHKGKVSTRKSK